MVIIIISIIIFFIDGIYYKQFEVVAKKLEEISKYNLGIIVLLILLIVFIKIIKNTQIKFKKVFLEFGLLTGIILKFLDKIKIDNQTLFLIIILIISVTVKLEDILGVLKRVKNLKIASLEIDFNELEKTFKETKKENIIDKADEKEIEKEVEQIMKESQNLELAFFNQFRKLENRIAKLYEKENDSERSHTSLRNQFNFLVQKGKITENAVNLFKELSLVRNKIAHGIELGISKQNLIDLIEYVIQLEKMIPTIESKVEN